VEPFGQKRNSFQLFRKLKNILSPDSRAAATGSGNQVKGYQNNSYHGNAHQGYKEPDPTQSVSEFTEHWNQQFKRGARANPNHPFNGRSAFRKTQRLRGTVQFTIAVIVAAVPISFYLVQPSNLRDAIAAIGSTHPETTARQVQQSQPANVSPVSGVNSRAQNKPIQVADAGRKPSEPLQNALQDTALEHARKHADPKYVCPMHPEIISDDPNAICPICGMDLVPLETGGDAGIVNLTPKVINSLGVRTAKVKRRTLYRRIDSVGYINVDENNMRAVSLRTDGWLEQMAVKTEGERVTKGQLLFELYAPTLVNAQEEYVQAMEHNNELLLKASRERLRALGVSDDQVSLLESTKEVEQLVKVYAPQSGIVSKLRVREGMYVKPSQPVIELVDLATVWLMVDIFERQASWVKVGQRAEATMPFMPGKSWDGRVEYVYPSLDASTRSLKVRLRFDNLEEELKPNMYADVTIYAKPKRKVLAIPKEALIVTGNQKRVIVALGEGRFIPMPVSVGMETDDKVEITNGLAEGDEVVTSSQFLIDSESSLKASMARMAGGGS
jgi:Cu(I)/Ag(I) efflux system membrane fusion protein